MRSSLLLAAAALALATGAASATSIGIGAFGGASIPIVQDDEGAGSQFGLRLPVNVVPLLTLEPYFVRSSLGQAEQEFGGRLYTRQGFDSAAFGVNVALGRLGLTPGFSFFPYAGIGRHRLTRDGSPDITGAGYNFGLGLGVRLAHKLALQVRGELNMVATGSTSRKFANLTAGLGYRLFP